MPPIFRAIILVHLKGIKDCTTTYFLEVWTSALAGASAATNLDKESKKMEDLYCSIRWSGPNFNSCIFLSLQFWEILKGIQHKFYLLKVHIYMKKSSSIVESWKSKKCCAFLLVLFKGKHGGVPTTFRTLTLVHLIVVGLCCNIFLRSRCIYSFRSCYRYKFEQRKPKNGRFWSIVLKVKYGGMPLIFSTCFFLFVCNFYSSLKVLRTKFSCCIYSNEKPATKIGSLKIKKNCSFVITLQEQIWWSGPTIQNSNFSSFKRGLVLL